MAVAAVLDEVDAHELCSRDAIAVRLAARERGLAECGRDCTDGETERDESESLHVPSLDWVRDESSHRGVRVLRAACYRAVSIRFGSRRRSAIPVSASRTILSATSAVRSW